MISILFWNVSKKPLQAFIKNIAKSSDLDLLLLVEFGIEPGILLQELNEDEDSKFFYLPKIGCEKVEIFSKFPVEFISTIYDESRITVRSISLPGIDDFLLAIAHLPSKLHWNDNDQVFGCIDLINAVNFAEKEVGHNRTILIGDLNMNPFEDGIIGSHGLHGIISRDIAKRIRRIVSGKEYMFFYNPMWNFFGDSGSHPPGTYYYNSSKPINYFWNIFDQVLVRPDLINYFDLSSLQILTTDGNANTLVNEEGLPVGEEFSDHLPLLFRLSI